MTRLAPLLLLALVLMGQDCDPAPPQPSPQGGTSYCFGLDYSILDSAMAGVGGIWDTIIGGEMSTNRRATVQVFFGSSYCSGVVLSPHTVLTAGHCGYGEGVEHRIKLEGSSTYIVSNESLVHPDYLAYINSGNTDLEARKSDLMLLYTAEAIPGPHVPLTHLYMSELAEQCYGLIAQGYGRDEYPETGAMLRESKYKITQETTKHVRSVMTDVGKVCFGDSGGPLYADVGPGSLYLAGITTTTMSSDCLTGASHVKVSHYTDWLEANVN